MAVTRQFQDKIKKPLKNPCNNLVYVLSYHVYEKGSPLMVSTINEYLC